MARRGLGWVVAFTVIGSSCSGADDVAGSEGPLLDTSAAQGVHNGAPMDVGNTFFTTFFVAEYQGDRTLEIEQVSAADVSESVVVDDSYVVRDPPTINASIRFLSLEGKERWLRDHHDPVLSDCVEGCQIAIIPPVTLIEPGVFGHARDFRVRYTVDGQEQEQQVDYQVGLCPIDAAECSFEDFVDGA